MFYPLIAAEWRIIVFEKNMRLPFLLDFYGEALDEHTRNILKAYYEDDLSLSEIAEDEKISRQGVRHIIKKGEEELEFLESKLRLAAQSLVYERVAEALSDVKESLAKFKSFDFTNEIKALDEAISAILNKGV
jgi:predicted DNA-binding protein YlxM (UPF0122 family)